MAMTIEARAKVNLTLEVYAKRADSFHALRSLVLPIPLADTVTLELASELTSDFPEAGDLALKAAAALRTAAGVAVGAAIRIAKRIPLGGGLGGGSADAAAVLRGLNRIWGLNWPLTRLAAVGERVGSDVPALVYTQALGVPVLMTGRGEVVAALPPVARPFFLVLVLPQLHVSTAAVYAAVVPRREPAELGWAEAALLSGDAAALAGELFNDLTPPAERLYPEIAAVRAALRAAGGRGVTMSGSGAAVIAVAPTAAEAERVRSEFKARKAGCACEVLAIGGSGEQV